MEIRRENGAHAVWRTIGEMGLTLCGDTEAKRGLRCEERDKGKGEKDLWIKILL